MDLHEHMPTPPIGGASSADPGRRPRVSHLWRYLTRAIVALAVLGGAASASAVSVTKETEGTVLHGAVTPVTVTVEGDGGPPYLYNLTIRDVLPRGVVFASGPAPSQTINLPDGSTVLVWSNLTDVSPASTYVHRYNVRHIDPVPPTVGFDVGQPFTNTAQGLLNSNPRIVPQVNGTTGVAVAGTWTHQDTDNAVTTPVALEITKEEPSPEGEILRGLHNHETTVTVNVRANHVRGVTGVVVDDYLPANFEFLGCGNLDNTPGGAVEYPGAPRLDTSVSPVTPCAMPALVETVNIDPDGPGPLPAGVYTHVRWTSVQIPTLGTMAPGAVVTFNYRAGVPLRENTTTWNGGTAPATNGPQAANLDNNNGPLTTDEQAIRSPATATGTYQPANGGPTVQSSDEDVLERTAEDVRMRKSVNPTIVQNGDIANFSIIIDTSEYNNASNVVVTDTMPNGMCPLGSVNHENPTQVNPDECYPTGATPSPAYGPVVENTDGTFTIIWNIASINASGTQTITYPARVRRYYQNNFQNDLNSPVLANDGMNNTVALTAMVNGQAITGINDPPHQVPDASSAGVRITSPAIDKKVSNHQPSMACDGTEIYSDGLATGQYRRGDRVCFELRATFPTNAFTGDVRIADFLPPGVVLEGWDYIDPGTVHTSGTWNADTATAGVVEWVRAADTTVPDTGHRFAVRLRAIVANDSTVPPGHIAGNLMKLSSENTPGQTFPLRDQVDFEITQPRVTLDKDITQVNGGAPTGTPPTVQGGDLIDYRVRPFNASSIPVVNAEIWDNLPPGVMCANVSNIVPAAQSCTDVAGHGRIIWTGVSIPANGNATLTYRVTFPQTYAPFSVHTNTAGVRQFDAATNRGGNYTYIPLSNIDPTQLALTPNENRGFTNRADDTQQVRVRDIGIVKTRVSTSLNETGNDNDQATPGETIRYRITTTIPDGVTITNGRITDTMGANQTRTGTGAPTATVNGGALPAGWDFEPSTLEVTLPSPLTIPDGTGDTTVVVEFEAIVQPAAGATRTNQGSVHWTLDGTTRRRNSDISTPIIRPTLTIAKSTDLGASSPTPGGYVTYTLTVRNTGSSRAHDNVVLDTLPANVRPVDASNNPLPVGIAPVPCPTTANPTNSAPAAACPTVTGANPGQQQAAASPRQIQWQIPIIEVGATVNLRYRVQLPTDEIASQPLTNTATVNGDSHPGNNPNQSTTSSNTSHTLTWAEPTIQKAVTPNQRVVGGTVQYTLTVVVPRGVRNFDSVIADRLPDGMSWVSYDSATCSAGCDPGDNLNSITTINPAPQANGSVLIGWWLNDIVPSTQARTLTLTYTARVDTTYEGTGTPVPGGAVLTNLAQLQWSTTDGGNTPPSTPPAPGPDTSTTTPTVSQNVTVIRPQVVMNKHVSCNGGTDPGPLGPDTSDECNTEVTNDPFTYTISVRNTGTSTAHDVIVNDVTPATLRDFTMGALPAGVTPVDVSAPDFQWRIAELPVNTTVNITYTARWLDSAQLPNTATAVNTASVPSYFGATEAERNPAPGAYPNYTDGGSDVVTLRALFPNVVLNKTTGSGAESGTAEVNQPFTWRITVQNTSSTVARNVIVRDTLPPNWTFEAGSTSISVDTTPPSNLSITPTVSGQNLTWTTGYNLPAGRTMTVTFQARPTTAVLDDAPPRTYVNTASSTVQDGQGNTGNQTGPYDNGPDTASATVALPEPSISKIPDDLPVNAGQANVPFQILAGNLSGTVDLRNAQVTDVLPAGTSFDAGSATVAVCTAPTVCAAPTAIVPTVAGQTLTFDVGTIAAARAVRIDYTVTVASPQVNGTRLVNTARLTATEIPTSANITDDGSLIVGSAPVWGSTTIKTSTPVTGSEVAPASNIEYRIAYENTGNANATQVVLTDEIPTNSTYVAGSTSTNGSATVSYRVGGTFQPAEPADASSVEAVRWTIPTVNAGTGGFQTFSVRVNQPLPDGTRILNLASITSNETPTPKEFGPDPFDPSIPTEHIVRSAPDLSLTKAVDRTSIELSREANRLTYTLRLANTGNADATDVTVEDTIPTGTTLHSINDGGAAVTCSTDPGTPGFTFGPCPTDLSTVTRIRWSYPVVETQNTSPSSTPRAPREMGFTVNITLPTVNGATVTNKADFDSEETPPGESNEVTTVIRSNPRITLNKNLSTGVVQPGGEISYLLQATNGGTAMATNSVISDEIPTGTRYVAGSATGTPSFRVGGAWQTTEPADAATVEALRWEIGTMEIDASVSVGFRVVVPAEVPRSFTEVLNTGSYSSDQGGITSNRVRTEVPHPPLPPGRTVLSIRKVALTRTPRAGTVMKWRIEVRNRGRVAAQNVRVCDPLPRALTLARPNVRIERTGAGRRTYSNARLRMTRGQACLTIPTLAVGQTARFTIQTRIARTVAGRLRNPVRATASNADLVSASAVVLTRRALGLQTPAVTG